jgi:hypothetical protein
MYTLPLENNKTILAPMFVHKAGSTEWITLIQLHLTGRCAFWPAPAPLLSEPAQPACAGSANFTARLMTPANA